VPFSAPSRSFATTTTLVDSRTAGRPVISPLELIERPRGSPRAVKVSARPDASLAWILRRTGAETVEVTVPGFTTSTVSREQIVAARLAPFGVPSPDAMS
jgi:hypothetical protein